MAKTENMKLNTAIFRLIISISIILNVRNVYSQEFKELFTRKIYSLAIDNDTVWVGGKAALFKLTLEGKIIKKYTVADGLPTGPYYSITVDNNIKWVATDNGIFSLCGNTVNVIQSANGQTIDSVTVVKTDDYGNIWFGTRNNGVWKYNKTSFVNFNSQNSNITTNRIDALCTHNDTVWVGGEAISFYANNIWVNKPSWSCNKGVTGIAVNKKGLVCYASSNFFYMFNPATESGGGRGFQSDITGLFELANGQVWFSTQDIAYDVSESLNFSNYLNYNFIIKADYDKNGNLWIVSENNGIELDKKNGNRATILLDDDQICSNDILCMAKDNKGNLWFGSTEGLSVYNGSGWKNYYKNNGLINDTVNTILPMANGDVWIGTNDGISKFDENGITDYENGKTILCAVPDTSGNIWFGTQKNGAIQYNGITWKEYKLNSFPVKKLFVDKNNVVWANNYTQLYYFENNKWNLYNLDFSHTYAEVMGVCSDTSGDVWCYGYNWFYNLNKKKAIFLSLHNTLEAEFDSLNNLWIRAYNILYKYDGKDLIKLNVQSWGVTTLPYYTDTCSLIGTYLGVYEIPLSCAPDTFSGKLYISSPNSLICENENITYSLEKEINSNNYSVLWTLPDGGSLYTPNQSFTIARITASGVVKAQYMNVCGAGPEVQKEITVLKYPTKILDFTGKMEVCAGEKDVQLKVTADSLSKSFYWGLPKGFSGLSNTNEIKIDISDTAKSGQLVVAGKNSCGTGPFLTRKITVVKKVPEIDSLSGKEFICSNNKDFLYQIATSDTGISYEWQLPEGVYGVPDKEKAYLNFDSTFKSGTIKVVSNNGCGSVVKQIEVKSSLMTQPTIIKKWNDLLICADTGKLYKNLVWFFNDKRLDNFTNKNYFIASQNGNYRLIATNSDGCKDSTSYNFNSNVTSKVAVSPNPFHNSFKIDFTDAKENIVLATLIDITGHVVKEYKFINNEHSGNINIEPEDIPEGIYLLKVKIGLDKHIIRILKK